MARYYIVVCAVSVIAVSTAFVAIVPMHVGIGNGGSSRDESNNDCNIIPMSRMCFQTLLDIIVDVIAHTFFGGDYAMVRASPNCPNVLYVRV